MTNTKTDCILISPAFSYDDGNIYKFVRAFDPPLNLITLAAWIREKGFSINVIDCNVSFPSIENLADYFYSLKNCPPKYLGISIYTVQAEICYKIAKICKNILPETIIISGGPHSTFSYEEVLNKSEIDIAVMGEGEISLEDILIGKPLNGIDGIAYKSDNGNIKVNPTRERIEDLNSLPIPAYDLIDLSKYRPTIGSFKTLPSLILTCSRGCPGNCSFCTKTLGKLHKQKDAHKIFSELKFLTSTYKINDFAFHDDTFTASRKNIVELCNLIIDSDLEISWLCYSRVDLVDEELLRLMKKAGCHQIMYGVESFDQNVLNSINKNINAEAVKKITKLTREIKITCKLTFIVGNPMDTVESLNLTLKNLLRINPDLIVVNIATPFPGTKMFEIENLKGTIKNYKWADYTGAIPIINVPRLDDIEIQKYYKKFYFRFYLRPSQILRILFRAKQYGGFYNLLKGAISILKISFSANN
jgi:radical SAM superfamily enzyme YgiQ (UPF0313 family)